VRHQELRSSGRRRLSRRTAWDLACTRAAFRDVPKSRKKHAAGLAGIDGLALITTQTIVWMDGRRFMAPRP